MIAYFDCFSGISGDMTLGALVDLGVPVDWLKASLARIPLDGFDVSARPMSRNGIRAQQITVDVAAGAKSRDYKAIKKLIEDSPFSDPIKKTSLGIFEKIAEAEAKIHGCPMDHVHFHEVGAIDAIVDIVGTALCVDYLKIERVFASKIPVGSGFVTCRHGTLPVPAPATCEILKDVPIYGTGIQQELVTPTGAAIIATLSESFGPMPEMSCQGIGYGAGERELDAIPNLLRVMAGSLSDVQADDDRGYIKDAVMVVETCIDDMNPEIFGFVMERLFEDGALDVYWMPVFMKKNRPGTLVHVLCHEDGMETIIRRILSETTTIGLRYYKAARRMLPREHVHLETSLGRIRAKQISELDGSVRIVPEYDECRQIARHRGMPIRMVYDTIIKEASEQDV